MLVVSRLPSLFIDIDEVEKFAGDPYSLNWCTPRATETILAFATILANQQGEKTHANVWILNGARGAASSVVTHFSHRVTLI
jgi:hypothetical protein